MTEDAWRWICGFLLAANAAQYVAGKASDKQARSDIMTMLPIVTDVKSVLLEVRELLR